MEDVSSCVKGNMAFAQKDFSGAIKHYTEALEDDEENVVVLCNRSAAYYEMELYKTSLKDAEAAATLDPFCIKALDRKATALTALGRAKEAQKAWTDALFVGGDLEVYMDIVSRLTGQPISKSAPTTPAQAAPAPAPVTPTPAPDPAQQAQPKQAHAAPAAPSPPATKSPSTLPKHKIVNTAVPDEPTEVSVRPRQGSGGLTLTASVNHNQQDPATVAAMAAAQNIITHGVGNVSVDEQIALGYLQVNTGKYKQGMAMFNRLLEKDPKLIAAYLGRGTAQALQGNLKEASKDFGAAIEADPTVADAWKRRGQTRAALGFDNEAIKDLTKAAQLQPDYECFHQRGIVYHKIHDYRRGLADFRKALDLNPSNHVTWNFVGLCENSLGRTREAIIAYERATKIEPRFKEAWANLAQAYRDYGDRLNAEKFFSKAFEVDKNYVHGFHLRGLLLYGCGEIRAALDDFTKGFELDSTDRNCQLMRAVCLQSLGLLSAAVATYSALLKAEPGHQCYYQKELCLYLHKSLDRDQMIANADSELDAYFKEAYCKRHSTNHPRICNYMPQKAISNKIPDVVLADTTNNEILKKIVDMSRKFGPLLQLNARGFLSNVRQHRMCGIAILQMAQQARAFWRQAPRKEMGGKKGKGGGGGGGGGGEFLYFDAKGSSKDNGKSHEYGWRDWMDIAVKWRQISEPNDPVFWIDLLAPEAFAEGFGLQTPMVTGQMEVIRYHPYFDRALAVVKRLIVDSGACNVHDQRFMLPRSKLQQLQQTKNCADMWEVMQQGFYVETPCHSLARPGKTMAGTRITLLQKQPDGFDFTIRTPGTPPRWLEMDAEMTHIWRLLTNEARRKPGPDLDKFTEYALTFYFYYVNFGPLSRGTAATGYIAFFALMLSIGYEVQVSPPEGTQTDWPAILSPNPMEFIDEIKKWMYPARTPSNVLDECPNVSANIFTARKMVEALNLK